jgi:lecithin:retinol acyltransferase
MARGDHIYVDRIGGLYSHHGIDCGDGTVVHYWLDVLPPSSSIRRTTLGEFAEGGLIKVQDYAACDPPDVVVGRALSSLGAGGFDPLTSNCEHFAVWCKTGRVESSQARSAESFLRDGPWALAVTLLFSPVLMPVAVFATLVRTVSGALTGETQGGRRR